MTVTEKSTRGPPIPIPIPLAIPIPTELSRFPMLAIPWRLHGVCMFYNGQREITRSFYEGLARGPMLRYGKFCGKIKILLPTKRSLRSLTAPLSLLIHLPLVRTVAILQFPLCSVCSYCSNFPHVRSSLGDSVSDSLFYIKVKIGHWDIAR